MLVIYLLAAPLHRIVQTTLRLNAHAFLNLVIAMNNSEGKSDSSPDEVTENVLKLMKSPQFKPTIFIEKYLAEKFCIKLHQAVEENLSSNSLSTFNGFLDCVLAVAEKDEKFISLYFGAMQLSFYEEITYILSKTF